MPTLAEQLLTPQNRPKVVADCVTLLDEEVSSKGGLGGVAVKTAYAVAKAMKPGFVKEVVEGLLDDFVAKLEPFWAARGGQPIASYLEPRRSEVADALLAITDERATKTKHASLRKTYDKLRPAAKRNVEQAVPRIGRLVAKYTTA